MLCAVASRSLSRDCILFLFYCKFTNLFDCDSKRNCQAQKNKDCHEQRTHHNHFLLFGAVWFAGIDPSKMKTLLFLLLELFEIYLHFALWNFVLSIPHVLSPGTFCHRQHAHAKRLKCCKKDFKIFVFLVLTRLSQNLVSLHVEKMFANIRKFRNNFTGFINRNKIIFRIFHKYLRSHASPEKFFQGGPCCHFSYPFHVADDAMQIGVHKTLYHFYTTNEMVHVAAWVKKIRFVGSKATMGFGKGRRWPSFILKFNIFH